MLRPPWFDGTGETIVIAGAYAWRDSDNTSFNTQWGLPQLLAGSGQVCTGPSRSSGCRFSTQNSIEIALDVEYAHGVAPGAAWSRRDPRSSILKLHCVQSDTSVMDFVVTALEEKLGKSGGRKRSARSA